VTDLVSCPHCGATNRVASEKQQAGKEPVCGRCKQPLSGYAHHPIAVSDQTFAEIVEQSKLPVLVDMWAPWCGPCRMVGPVLDQLAGELAGRLRIVKVNVDENQMTSERFRIQSIPALLLFKNGEEIDRIVGALPKTELLRRIERFI
jgi:thioredoxin 2